MTLNRSPLNGSSTTASRNAAVTTGSLRRRIGGALLCAALVAAIPVSAADAAVVTASGADIVGTDYNGDGRSDIALTNASGGWLSIPTAFSNGGGSFTAANVPVGGFAGLASVPGARVLSGDYNGDGRSDIAMTGGRGWQSIPVALANSDGSFTTTNLPAADFAGLATLGGSVTGDYNGDGKSDIALAGGSGWQTIPVAFSNGNGSFLTSNLTAAEFPGFAAVPGVRVLTGDYNGDRRTDLALAGGRGWASIPVALSNGDGSFTTSNLPADGLPGFAAVPGVRVLTGDYNGDGRSDIALTGGSGWQSIPVAFSNGNGSFTTTNLTASEFPVFAAMGVHVLSGDYNGDGRSDIALAGGRGWATVPVAFSNGNGTFQTTNLSAGAVGGYATLPGVRPVSTMATTPK